MKMNIEIVDEWLNEEYGVSYTDLEELHNRQVDKNIELQEIIQNAIEYIKECTSSPDKYEKFISTNECKKLLNILKGRIKMSKIVKESGYRELSHIVKSKNKYYLVDSNNTRDAGYETMVFPYNIKEDKVESWTDIYCERYDTEEEMRKHHFEVCNNIEKYLQENKTIDSYGGVDPFWFLY